ncbi:MAG: phage tail protein [Gammaproteobacteria bacterium]|nr:phage tail protein [Gammaproteobacteria bacterium]
MSVKQHVTHKALPLLAALGLSINCGTALAGCGSDDYIGDICLVGFNFCPRDTLEAAGQVLQISQYPALFSLYGTTYGGDGRTTFALPDLRSRTPIGSGSGPGLRSYTLGRKGGAETHALSAAQLPWHNHAATTSVDVSVDSTLRAASGSGNTDVPGYTNFAPGNVLARRNRSRLYSSGAGDVDMDQAAIYSQATATAATTLGDTGNSQSFDLREPWLAIKYCVVLEGSYPTRN